MTGADRLWRLVADIGAGSSAWREQQVLSDTDRPGYIEAWKDQFGDMQLKNVTPRISSWRSWNEWACKAGVTDPAAPPPHVLAQWLKNTTARGPTVATGHLARLIWLNKKLGLSIPVDSLLLSPYRTVPRSHAPQQQRPYAVSELVHFETLLLQGDNIFVQQAAAVAVLVAYGALRYAHLQRSQLLGLTESVLVGACTVGKSQSASTGRREGFVWTVPRFGIAGTDIGLAVMNLVGPDSKLIPNRGQDVLFLDFEPSTSLAKATNFVGRPLSLGKWQMASQQCLQLPPLCRKQDDVGSGGSYRCRRVLSTIAGEVPLSQVQSAAIGDWVSQTGDEAGRSRKIANAMFVRYNDNSLALAARAKLMCVAAIRRLASRKCTFSFLLSEITGELDSRDQLEELTKDGARGIRELLDGTDTDQSLKAPELPFRPDDDGVDGAAAGSDTSSESEEVDEFASVQSLFASISWFIPAHNRAALHFIRSDGPGPVEAACGRSLKRTQEPQSGFWSFVAHSNKVCEACLRVQDTRVQAFVRSW
jgi:hypothetical protein